MQRFPLVELQDAAASKIVFTAVHQLNHPKESISMFLIGCDTIAALEKCVL